MSARWTNFREGDEIINDYPFVRTRFTEWREDGPSDILSWKPGVGYELRPPHGEYADAVADGVGKQILTVIDIHKPGRFPTRVFYTVQWVTPDGKKFGKGGLKITTLDAFRRKANGFMYGRPGFEGWSLRNQDEAAA